MIKKVVISSIILLFVLMPFAYAWVEIRHNDYWDICEFGHWKFIGNGEGEAIYQLVNVSSGLTYHGVLNVSDLVGLKANWWEFWIEGWEKTIALQFNYTLENGSWFCFYVQVRHVTNLWGLIQQYALHMNFKINATSWQDITEWQGWDAEFDNVWTPKSKLEFFVNYSPSTGRVEITLFNYGDLKNDVPLKMTIPNVGGARPDADYVGHTEKFNITLRVWHYGNGNLEAYYNDSFEEYPAYPQGRTLSQEGLQAIAQIPYVGGFFAVLLQFMNFIFAMITGTLVAFVRYGLPIMPYILIFWLLDAMITSVYVGDIQPIGEFFMTVFNFMRAIIQTIANIISGLVDAVKWW
jgi:hypothetical protein